MGLLARLVPIALVGVTLVLLAAAVSGGGVAPVFEPTQGDLTNGGLISSGGSAGLPTTGGGGSSVSGGAGTAPAGGGASASPGTGGPTGPQGNGTSGSPTATRSGATQAATRSGARAIQTGLRADSHVQETLTAVRRGEASQQQLTAALDSSLADGPLNDAFRTAAANGSLRNPATGTAVSERTVRKRLANETAREDLAATLAGELTTGELSTPDASNGTAAPHIKAVTESLARGALGQAVGRSLAQPEAAGGVNSETATAFVETLTESPAGKELAKAFEAAESPQQRKSAIAQSNTQAALTEALTTGSLGKALGTHGDSAAAAATAATLTDELQSGSLGRSLYDAYSDTGRFTQSAATTAATTSPTLAGSSGASQPGALSQSAGEERSSGGTASSATGTQQNGGGTRESSSPRSAATGAQPSSSSSGDQSGDQASAGGRAGETGGGGPSPGSSGAESGGAGASSAAGSAASSAAGFARSGGGLLSGVPNSLSDVGVSPQTAIAIAAIFGAVGLVWAHRRYGLGRDSPRQFARWLLTRVHQLIQAVRDSFVYAASVLRRLPPWLWTQLRAGGSSLLGALWVLLTIPARLLGALAGLIQMLTPRRIATGIRSHQSDADSSRLTVPSGEASVTRSGIRKLWDEFVSAINPPNYASKTPGEIGRYAIQRGVPSRPAQYIVEKFRQVEYASGSADAVDMESVADAVSDVKAAATTSTESDGDTEGPDGA